MFRAYLPALFASEGVVPLAEEAPKPRRRRRKKKKKKKSSLNVSTADDISVNDEDVSVELFVRTKGQNQAQKPERTGNKMTRNTAKTNAPNGSSNISTLQQILRDRLIETDGFEVTRVDQAMEDMWEKGMPFDEYNAVITYLQNGDYCGTIRSGNSVTVASVSTKTEDETAQSQRSGDLTNSDAGDSLHPTEIREETIATAATGDVEEDEDDICEEEEEASTNVSSPAPPPTMAEKLDFVANNENLADAVYALTQWVQRAAEEEDIQNLVRAEETVALVTVVKRGVSSDDEGFETAVQPGLLRLLMAVLKRCGINQAGSTTAELEKRLVSMLKQARKVVLLASDEKNVEDGEYMIAERISRFIVSRLTISMEEIEEYNKGNSTSENDKNRGSGQATSTNSSFVDEHDAAVTALMSQRDTLKMKARNAFATVESSLQTLIKDSLKVEDASNDLSNGHASSSSSPTSALEVQAITLLIVDEQTKTRFEEETARLQILQGKVPEQDETNETVESLQESIVSIQEKRSSYQKKIAEMKLALEELEAIDQDAAQQIKSLLNKIKEKESDDEMQAKQIQKNIDASKKSIEYANLVESLAEMMKTYAEELEKATWDAKNQNQSCTLGTITKLSTSRAMKDYLLKTQEYFTMEAQCEVLLRHKVTSEKIQLTALRSELDQYCSARGLGSMVVITKQLKESISKKENIVKTNTKRIETITKNALAMYNNLMESIKSYEQLSTEEVGVENGEDDVETLFPTPLLHGLSAAIRSMKLIPSGDLIELDPFVLREEQKKTAILTKAPEATAVNNSASAAPASLPSRKSSWGNLSAIGDGDASDASIPKNRLSFIEIQQEELRSRSDSTSSIDDA